MAQPPDVNETFLREVDENLRRDQLRDFFRTYGTWLIAGALLFLAASGGLIWWKQHRIQRSQAGVEQLAQIFNEIGAGKSAQAEQQLGALANDDSRAVSASARFARAALAIQANDTKAAATIYKGIANDGGLPQPYRDAALVRQTTLEFDQMQPAEVIARLQPLNKPGEPWFGGAGELTALALAKQGKRDEAGRLFATIAKDNAVPPPLRERAAQLASSFGADIGAALQNQAR